MSSMDYLCCKKCDGKIFYDAHDDLLDRLDDYFEGKGLLCPDCVEKVETELAEARARADHLERIVDEMTEEQAALCAEGQSITELVAAKDKLIEQMRELLQFAVEDWAHKFNHDENPEHGGWAVRAGNLLNELQKAALSAAERMGK